MSETSVKTEGNATASQSQAVTVAKPAQAAVVHDYTMGLFPTDKFLNTPQVARAFGVKSILDKDGNEVGFRTPGRKRGDIARDNGLTTGAKDKDKLDGLIRDSQETYLKLFKAWLLMQPDGALGISGYSYRTDKNGVGTHAVRFRELPVKAQADLQKLADAYGIPVDRLVEHLAKLKAPAAVELQGDATGTGPIAKGGESAKPANVSPVKK